MNRAEESGEVLRRAVKGALLAADPETVEILTAVTGLLAAVAYADRIISPEEGAHLKAELFRIQGLNARQIDVVAAVLEKHALRLSTAYTQRFTRTLRDHLPEEMRAEVLDTLLGMAAADGSITYDEINHLRAITTAMGLSQQHYNELQHKYRDKLG